MNHRRILICVVGAVLWASEAAADVVYLRGQSPVFGIVVREEANHIVFRQRLEDRAGYRERLIPHNDMITFVVTIEPEVLSTLAPDQPARYRDVAEQLAVQRLDPEARDLALRLYLLGARYGDGPIRESCFRGLLPLARTPDEELAFRILAWQTLGDEGNWLDSVPTRAQPEVGSLDEQSELQLRDILRSWRQGDRNAVVAEIEKPWFRETVRPFASICSWQDLRRWTAEPELKTEWLARILELEIALARTPDVSSDEQSWSVLIRRQHQRRGPVTFVSVTEFDLSQSVFVDGQWMEPSAETGEPDED